MSTHSWNLGGEKDPVSITADWTTVSDRHIDGVCIREVRNVPTGYGHLTELFRADWDLGSSTVGQVFQSVLLPGRVSAWHAHGETTDRLFVSDGQMLVVLYDARPDSPTHSTLMTVRTSILRPQLIVVPPRIWHGIKNTGNEPATLINAVDIAYRHDGPDHYRLPETTDQIPFDISTAT